MATSVGAAERARCHARPALARHHGRCRCHGYVVMADPVHLLIALGIGGDLADLMRSFGRVTAWNLNRLQGRSGGVWQKGFYNHQLRNEDSRDRRLRYLAANPVRQGYVTRWQEWPWTPSTPLGRSRLHRRSARPARPVRWAGTAEGNRSSRRTGTTRRDLPQPSLVGAGCTGDLPNRPLRSCGSPRDHREPAAPAICRIARCEAADHPATTASRLHRRSAESPVLGGLGPRSIGT